MACGGDCFGRKTSAPAHQQVDPQTYQPPADDYVLISANLRPNSGWKYVDPNTRFEYGSHTSLFDLTNQINAHRSDKLLPTIENVSQKIHNYLASLPENEFLYTKIQRSRTLKDYVSAIPHAGAIMGQREFVDEYEAKRRAKMCSVCPHNGELRTNATDRVIDNRLLQKVKDKHTGYDAILQHCLICKCLLRAKVWALQEVVTESLTTEITEKLPHDGSILDDNGNPFNCWQLDK